MKIIRQGKLEINSPVEFALKSRQCTQLILTFFIVMIMGKALAAETASTNSYEKDNQKLIVYSDVPGLKPSEFYKMRVRSEATKGVWIDVFCHISRSLYSSATMPTSPSR